MKTCSSCKVEKQLGEFYRDGYALDGLRNICKPCSYEAHRAWRAKNLEHARAYHRRYSKARYVPRPIDPLLTTTTARTLRVRRSGYDALLEKQEGVCAICKEPESRVDRSGKPGRLSIDHNHLTGQIRGLLCHKCNVGLGHFRDDPDLLLVAMEYLLKWQEERAAQLAPAA